MAIGTVPLLVLFLVILLVPILAGLPVAYGLGLSSLAIMLLPFGPSLNVDIFAIRMSRAAESFTLLAVPFYLYAGRLLNEGGATEALFDFAKSMVGHFTGGIGQVNVIASLLFSGMSGSAIADAAGLGNIEYEMMQDAGYDDDISLAVTGSSALIGPIIPPSIPLIVYAAVAQVSITDLFLAGIVPGVLMGVALMILVFIYALRRDYAVSDRQGLRERWSAFLKALPALVTIVIILGGLLAGLFTATEAGAIAVVWVLFIGTFAYGGLDRASFVRATKDSVRDLAALVVIFLIASVYSFTVVAAGIPDALVSVLLGLNVGPSLTLLVIVFFLLLLGMVLGPLVLIFLFVPLIAPEFAALGVDPIHAGIVLVIALMMGLLTPPFGGILFVLERVTGVSTTEVSKSIAPFLVPLVIVLLVLIFFPSTVLWVPENFG
jgi:tripartite ATP-independent transporter DctM subunit